MCWDGTVYKRLHAALRGTPLRRSVSEAVALVSAGLVLLAVGLVQISITPWAPAGLGVWWHAIPLVLGGVVLLAKRHRPLGTLLAGIPVVLVDLWLGLSLPMVLIVVDLIYSATVNAGATAVRRLRAVIGVATITATVAAAVGTRDAQATVLVFIQFFALLCTPLWWGLSVRRQADLAALASARAGDLEQMAQMRESQVVREERNRMARDLHDALSSNLSAVAIRSEAALQTPASAGASETGSAHIEALRDIRASSLAALSELRAMVLLLRSGSEDATSAAGLESLPALVQAAGHSGLHAELTDTPAPDSHVPTAAQHAAYRIVQESLTNAAKHSPGASVQVSARLAADELVLRVDSRGQEQAPGPQVAPSPGLGLEHMRERAGALHGTLDARWHNADTWRVEARLPITEAT